MNYSEEQFKKIIAQMNVFSQHQKVMEESYNAKKRSSKKIKKQNDEKHGRI